jgi:hypothetical protein
MLASLFQARPWFMFEIATAASARLPALKMTPRDVDRHPELDGRPPIASERLISQLQCLSGRTHNSDASRPASDA